MGFDLRRFLEAPDEELICPICRFVLQDPLQIRGCEHAFCATCIHEWLQRSQTCPIDRSSVENGEDDLISPPRILRNLLSRLEIECDNAEYGCTQRIRLDNLEQHLKVGCFQSIISNLEFLFEFFRNVIFRPKNPCRAKWGVGSWWPRTS